MANRMTADFQFLPRIGAAPRPVSFGLGGRLAHIVRWVLDMPRRRAVLNELESLSDHELADIGLARADVPHVFARTRA